MTIPRIEYQTINIQSDSLNRKLKFRPILVKEEKILLMAKESGVDSDIYSAVKQVVENCILEDNVNVSQLPLYELEYIFLQLRVTSIGGTIELAYKDSEDEQEYRFNINLQDIKIVRPENSNPNIDLGNDTTLVLRYPPATLYDDKTFLDANDSTISFESLLCESMVDLYIGEELFDISSETKEEKISWLETLEPSSYKKIQEFFLSIPYMYYEIKYNTKNGTERSIKLRTLSDFFIL